MARWFLERCEVVVAIFSRITRPFTVLWGSSDFRSPDLTESHEPRHCMSPDLRRSALVRAVLLVVIGTAGCTSDAPVGETPGDDVPEEGGALELVATQTELFGAPGAQTNAWADADGDGDLDLFVGFRGAPNRLYRNDRGTFVDVAAELGLADETETRAAAWGDYDLDGDPDLYIGYASSDDSNRLYRNDRAEGFVDVAEEVGVSRGGVTRQPSWIDFDGRPQRPLRE